MIVLIDLDVILTNTFNELLIISKRCIKYWALIMAAFKYR